MIFTIYLIQIMLLKIGSLSPQGITFNKFEEITTLSNFFGPKESRLMMQLYFWSLVVLIAFTSILYIIDPTRIYFHWGHLNDSRLMSNLFYGEVLTTPIFFYLLWLYSRRIKRALKRRGIIVHGWHWRGIEVDASLLKQFTEYLDEQSMLNEKALSNLIEASRDELISVTRPQNIAYAYFAVIFAIIAGVGSPLLDKVLDIYVPDQIRLGDAVALIATVLWVFAVIATMWFYNHIAPKTQLEVFLQSLHSILIKHSLLSDEF